MKIIDMHEEDPRRGRLAVGRIVADVRGGQAEVTLFEGKGNPEYFAMTTQWHIDMSGENTAWQLLSERAYPEIVQFLSWGGDTLEAATEAASEWILGVETKWDRIREAAQQIQDSIHEMRIGMRGERAPLPERIPAAVAPAAAKVIAPKRGSILDPPVVVRTVRAAANVAPLPSWLGPWNGISPKPSPAPLPTPLLPGSAEPRAKPPQSRRAEIFDRAVDDLLELYATTKDKSALKLALRAERAAARAARRAGADLSRVEAESSGTEIDPDSVGATVGAIPQPVLAEEGIFPDPSLDIESAVRDIEETEGLDYGLS